MDKPSERRGGTRPDDDEARAKGEWAETSQDGIVPAPEDPRRLPDLWRPRCGAGHHRQPAGILRNVPIESALQIARPQEIVDPALEH